MLAVAGAAGVHAGDGFLTPNLLALGEHRPAYALLVDKESEKMFLFQGDGDQPPSLLRAWNVSTGQNEGDKTARGDHRTPVGIYFFEQRLEDRELPAMYGVGAFVMDYPNLFDRLAGRTGSGIWLHATDEIARPLTSRQTRGCIVVTNQDILELSRYVSLDRTPIIVEERIERISAQAWRAARQELMGFRERWRSSWSNGDLAAYRQLYAARFRADGMARAAWLGRRESLRRWSDRVELDLGEPVMLAGAGQAILRFPEEERSDAVARYVEKTLWLEREAGEWRIVGESARRLEPPPAVAARLGQWSRSPAAEPADRPRTARAAPAPAAASRIEAAPAARQRPVVAISEFLADAGEGEVQVTFRVGGAGGSAEELRGRVAVVAKVTMDGGTRHFAWPGEMTLLAGEPASPPAGRRVSLDQFRQVEARILGVPVGSRLEGVSVVIWDEQGVLLLREHYGG